MDEGVKSRLDLEISEKESQLTSLKAEIIARQRLIAGLNEKVDSKALQDKVRRLEDELSVRDKQIAVLNDRLIILDSQQRERAEAASHASRILSLEAELTTVKSSRDEAEDLLRDSRIELEEVMSRCNETASALESQRTQMQQKLKAQQQEADSRLLELKSNYEEVIVKANKDLSVGRSQAEELSSQLRSKTQQLAENEGELHKMTLSNQSLTEKLSSLSQKLELMQKLNSQLEQVNSQTDQLKGSLTLEVEKYQVTLQRLQAELKEARDENSQLEECVKEQQIIIERAEGNIRLEGRRCQELEDYLSKLEHSYKGELTAISSRLMLTAAELEQVRTQLQQKKVEAQEVLQLKNELRLMREQITALAVEKRGITEKLGKAEEDRDKIGGELRSLVRKYEGAKVELTAKTEEHEGSLKEHESQLKKLKRRFQEENVQLKDEAEEKLNKISSLQGQIDELKKKLQDTQVKMKAMLAEQLTQANQNLDERDQQIKLLKDMLKSAQTQVRQREEELGRLKKKLVESKRPGQ
jgi:chromosome segregation ATPase